MLYEHCKFNFIQRFFFHFNFRKFYSNVIFLYRSQKGNRVKRGCVQDLIQKDEIECENNTDTCKVCIDKNCNSRIKFQECYNCNSQFDPFCIKVSNKTEKTEICKSYDSHCVTGIDKRGHTHRACGDIIKSLSYYKQFPLQYDTCQFDKCNNRVVPSNRLHCYQANGVDMTWDFIPGSIVAEPCSIVSKHDKCYTYLAPSNGFFSKKKF